jgi:hypothetical protein
MTNKNHLHMDSQEQHWHFAYSEESVTWSGVVYCRNPAWFQHYRTPLRMSWSGLSGGCYNQPSILLRYTRAFSGEPRERASGVGSVEKTSGWTSGWCGRHGWKSLRRRRVRCLRRQILQRSRVRAFGIFSCWRISAQGFDASDLSDQGLSD